MDVSSLVKGIVASIIAIAVISFSLTGFLRIREANIEREVFKATTTYNESAATFLADSYKEYNDAENDVEKTAIMEYVVMRYPNLDSEKIDNETLKEFYLECLE